MTYTIHAFIICWPGKEENARHIANEIQHSVDRLTVIYSNRTAKTEAGAGHWVKVSDDWYYGKKFMHSLQLNTGNIMLQIQADAVSGNWKEVVNRCKAAHTDSPNVGVWAPDFDYTAWRTEKVMILENGDGKIAHVAQTDGIVWSVSEPVIRRLKEFDYDANNIGWGIDWAAITYSLANNLLVVRDTSVVIDHPRSRGYSAELGDQQMSLFLEQLTVQEEIQRRLLNAIMKNNVAAVKKRDSMKSPAK